MLNICSRNVRGLNDPVKQCLVKFVVSKLQDDVLCFQETKVSAFSRSFISSFADGFFDKCHFIQANGASRGIFTSWNSRYYFCTEVLVRKHSLTLRLKHCASGTLFHLTNVYGPASWAGKEEFCLELAALKIKCTGPWVLCGDFNFTKNQNERRGRSWSRKLMSLFFNLINELELVDLPIAIQLYTWSNMQVNPTLAKLDRFLISTEWDFWFPISNVTALPRITLDHSPLLLKTNRKPLVRTFKFEKVWLTREDFIKLVPVWWNEVQGGGLNSGSNVLVFAAKLRHCRKKMKEWCGSNFHNILNAKRMLSEDLQKMDILEEARGLNSAQQRLRINLKAQLTVLIRDEEIFWKTRAKQHWLKEGDGNTEFFHAMANARKRVNHIEFIEDDGRRLTRDADKSDYFYKKFKARFTPEGNLASSFGDWSDVFSKDSWLGEDHLTAPFSENEIKKATF